MKFAIGIPNKHDRCQTFGRCLFSELRLADCSDVKSSRNQTRVVQMLQSLEADRIGFSVTRLVIRQVRRPPFPAHDVGDGGSMQSSPREKKSRSSSDTDARSCE